MLVEKEKCNEVPCYTYYWQTTAWTECQLQTDASQKCEGAECQLKDARCGFGVQQRDVSCLKSGGGEKQPIKRYF